MAASSKASLLQASHQKSFLSCRRNDSQIADCGLPRPTLHHTFFKSASWKATHAARPNAHRQHRILRASFCGRGWVRADLGREARPLLKDCGKSHSILGCDRPCFGLGPSANCKRRGQSSGGIQTRAASGAASIEEAHPDEVGWHCKIEHAH